MPKIHFRSIFTGFFVITGILFFTSPSVLSAENNAKSQGPPKVPVQVAVVTQRQVSSQISLVGTTEATATSMVAAEVAGMVEHFPVREGDFVRQGDVLARLKNIEMNIRLKGAVANREMIRAKLENAEKELNRYTRLKDTDSIAARKYDEALYAFRALSQELLYNESAVQRLEYEISQTRILAPFSGFIAKEHTQVGEWVNVGAPVVTLVDLRQVRITVDVPQRYAVMLSNQSDVKVVVKSISDDAHQAKIFAILPKGNPEARTFAVRLYLENPGYKIKSGMEVLAAFGLSDKKQALLVPKDAVVTAGDNRLVFTVADGKAAAVPVKILGYYDADVAVEGDLKPGAQVVIRGNERLRPGQDVFVQE
jgi:RND family efflux transporter MFP subunit